MNNPTVIVAAEIYSQNLGDGVIYETTRYLIQRIQPEIQVVPYDISLRTGWAAEAGKGTSSGTGWRQWIRRSDRLLRYSMLAQYPMLRRKTLLLSNRLPFADASGVIIGGGQLLSDRCLSFPLKLHAVEVAARKVDVPVHVFSCGVGPAWSRLGGRLLRRLLKRAKTVSVRDELSIRRLAGMVPGLSPLLSADPALWAREAYANVPATASEAGMVGLGIIAPDKIDFHTSEKVSVEQWESFWLGILQQFTDRKRVCQFFCNGSQEDYAFALNLQQKAMQAGLSVEVVARPVQPHELVATLRSYDAVMAVRLHANIIASSFGIPNVGFLWNEKVAGFYRALGCEERCLPLRPLDSIRAVAILQEATEKGIDTDRLEALKQRASGNIQAIVTQLCQSPAASPADSKRA